MVWGNTLEEDLSLSLVDIGINPFSPSVQPLLICHQTIHIIIGCIPFLN